MSRRERLERKLAKRQEWAGKAEARAEERFGVAHAAVAGIPFGQPVLVGHHSERHHRAALDRCDGAMRRGVEESELAKHHAQAADTITRQLDRSIFTDDDNALEALRARIAEHEAKREHMRTVNRLFRKGDAAALAALGLDLARLQAGVAASAMGDRAPYPPYLLSNLGGRITTDRKRLEYIDARQKRAAGAEAAGGMLVEPSGEYVRVTFVEKPAREILDALKAAGFTWSGGSWCGRFDAWGPIIAQFTTGV